MTNYTIKHDCNEYQKFIGTIIVRKTFNNHDNNIRSGSLNYRSTFNKFASKAFNQLFHHWEISELLIVSYLRNLSYYYSLKPIVKIIYIYSCSSSSKVFIDIK